MYSLAVKDAYDAKQEAYQAMDEARNQLRELGNNLNSMYVEIGRMQADFDVVNSEATAAWEKHKAALDSYDELINDVNLAIQDAKDLKEQFERKLNEGGEGSDYRKSLYREAFFLFKEKEIELNESRKLFINEKRNVERPDTTDKDAMLQELKAKRAEHAELTKDYRSLKEKVAKLKAVFDQAQAKYYELRNAEHIEIVEKANEEKIEILKKANVPEQFWDDAVVDYLGDETHIYYGGDEDHAHGHITLKGGKESYKREPHVFNLKIG